MGGRVTFRGGRGASGSGAKSRGDSGSGARDRGAVGGGARGRGADGWISDSRGSNPHVVARTTPLLYTLHDTPDTPESPKDSVGTPFPIDALLVRRPGSSSSVANASPSIVLVAEAIAAENIAARAASTASAAAETAASTASAAIAAAAVAAAAAAAAAGDDENFDGVDLAGDIRITLRVVPGKKPRFEPSASTRSGKILRSRVCKERSKWAKFTQVMKDFYWEEFKWPSAADVSVKECWNTCVAKQYNDFINDRKNDTKKDSVPEAVWSRWNADWNTPDALELSQLKRDACKGGQNGQCSKHTWGSITVSEHAKRFEKKNKRKPMYNELFDLMHRRKGGKEFVDDKSASIDAAFKARKLQFLEQSDGSPMPSVDDIYLEVVGGQNKDGDVYGIGSQNFPIINQSSCSSGSEQPEVVSLSVVQDIVHQFFTEFEQQNEERLGQRIGKEKESRITPLQSMLLAAQNLIASLSTLSEATQSDQVSEDPTNDAQANDNENCLGDDLDDPMA